MLPRGHRAFVAIFALLVLATSASAHAVLLQSDPASGSRLDYAPLQVSVTLTEAVDPAGSDLRVLDVEGTQVDLGDLRIVEGQRPVFTVSLPEDLPDGAYRAQWLALSTVDGHFTAGTVGFAVGGFTPPGSHSGETQEIDAPSLIGRTLAFIGVSLFLGALVWQLFLPVRSPQWHTTNRRTMLAGLAVNLVGIVLILVDGRNDAGLSSVNYLGTTSGQWQLRRLILAAGTLLLAIIWHIRPVKMATPLLTLGIAGTAFASARLGHASQNGITSIVLDGIHFISSTAWLGALALFVVLLSRPASYQLTATIIAGVGRRFGTIATALVVVTIATGLITTSAVVGELFIRRPAALLDDNWSRFLFAKILLTVAMLAVALLNRRVFVAEKGLLWWVKKTPAHPRFGKLVALEVAFGVVVLGCAGALTSLGAPQGVASQDGLSLSSQGDEIWGSVTISPAPVAGASSDLSFFIQSEYGVLRNNTCGRDTCVKLEVAADGGAAETFFAVPSGGTWKIPGLLWAAPGAYNLTLEIQSQDIYQDQLRWQIAVAAPS